MTVVDRTDEEPWKRSLMTSPLIDRLRVPGSTVVCVSNTTGRARVLACRSCRSLIRCEATTFVPLSSTVYTAPAPSRLPTAMSVEPIC